MCKYLRLITSEHFLDKLNDLAEEFLWPFGFSFKIETDGQMHSDYFWLMAARKSNESEYEYLPDTNPFNWSLRVELSPLRMSSKRMLSCN
ncbi:hypothetical protein ACLKA7_012573 [Drosophila subpalustris]